MKPRPGVAPDERSPVIKRTQGPCGHNGKKREMGIAPTTKDLERPHSTAELHPH